MNVVCIYRLQPSLGNKRVQHRKHKLERLAAINRQRCDLRPVYGQDLYNVVASMTEEVTAADLKDGSWKGVGHVHCKRVHGGCCSHPSHPSVYWGQTDALRDLLHTPEQYVQELREVINRYILLYAI